MSSTDRRYADGESDGEDGNAKGKLKIAVEMDKVGMGVAQIEIMILSGGVFMTEGCLLVIASVIVRTLEVRWGTTLFHSMLLAVAMFLGVSMGCMAGGLSADQHGRRPAILVCYVGTLVMLPINAAAMHWIYLSCGNLIIGFFFGYGIPAAQSLIAETCPSDQRQNLVCMSAIMFAVGQMTAGIVVWLVNPYLEYEDVNWRMMMLLSAVPVIVVGPWAYLRLPESPMWLFVSGEKARAYDFIRLIGYRNGVTYERSPGASEVSQISPLVTPHGDGGTDTEGEPLGTWRERARALFGPKYKWQTLQLMLICFSGNLCYYGLIYILPETFSEMMMLIEDETGGQGEKEEHFSPALNLMLSAVFEVPGVLLAILLSNTVRRKMSLAISFSVVSISCISLVAASQRKTHAIVLTSLSAFSAKLFVASVYILCFLFVLEAYPTAMRSSGLAFCMTFGRLGAFVIPIVAELVVHIHDSSIPVFVVLGTAAGLASVISVLLPDRTSSQPTAAEELDSTDFVRDRLESKSFSDGGTGILRQNSGSLRGDSKDPKDATIRGLPGYKSP
jgi:AAHS family benzoate transporter-like MFS transporter